MTWVWEHSDTSGNDRLVLLALADDADDSGGSCYPSLRRLAAKVRVHTSTISAAIRRLEEGGHLRVTRPEKQGRGHHNRYELVMDDPVDNPPSKGAGTAPLSSEKSADRSPEKRGSGPALTRSTYGTDPNHAPVSAETVDNSDPEPEPWSVPPPLDDVRGRIRGSRTRLREPDRFGLTDTGPASGPDRPNTGSNPTDVE